MKMILISLIILVVVIGSFEASSEELGRATLEFDVTSGGFCAARERIQIVLMGGCYWFDSEFGWVCIECWLWSDIWLTTSDIGTTLTAFVDTTSSWPSALWLAQSLTDNVKQKCGVWVFMESYFQPGNTGCGSGPIDWEDIVFSLDGNDFHGATITSFSVVLNSLSFESASNPNMKNAHVSVTWIVNGISDANSIEPSTWGHIKALYNE